MTPSWPELHELEIAEKYPDAIDGLEQRLRDNPSEREAVLRLGFNLWYVVAEEGRLSSELPFGRYAARFMELFRQHHDALEGDAEFCWVFGQGMQMVFFYLPGATEELGIELIQTAERLDAFWANFWSNPDQNEMARRLRGRGIFQSYYSVS